jgi:hypothetical protein
MRRGANPVRVDSYASRPQTLRAGRPGGIVVLPRTTRQPLLAAPVCIHDIDIAVASARAREGDPSSIA